MATLAKPTIPEDGLAGPTERVSIVPPLRSVGRKQQSGGVQQSFVPQTLMRRDASEGLNIANPTKNNRGGSTRRTIASDSALSRDHSKGLVKAPQRNNLDENLQTSLVKRAIEKSDPNHSSPTSSIWDTVTTSLFGSGEEVDPLAGGCDGDRLDVSHWQKMAKKEAKKEKREAKENK